VFFKEKQWLIIPNRDYFNTRTNPQRLTGVRICLLVMGDWIPRAVWALPGQRRENWHCRCSNRKHYGRFKFTWVVYLIYDVSVWWEISSAIRQ